MDKTLLKKMELWGTLFIFGAATLLHFSYQWSDKAVWSVLFGAVNESVWEHIKIFAMPYMVWAGFELAFARPHFRRFFVSKIIGLYFLTAVITAFTYIYTGFVGKNILWVDIISVFIWVLLSNFLSYILTVGDYNLRPWFSAALFCFMLYAVMYFSFSAAPPQIGLFKDPLTNGYGIT